MKRYFTFALLSTLLLPVACGGSDDSGSGNESASQLTSVTGEPCPEVAEDSEQCLTTEEDVAGYRALEVGMCGMDMSSLGLSGCSELDQAGELDADCPDVTLAPGAPPLAGCCSVAGVCGAMDTLFGLGCMRGPDPSMHVACGD